MTLKAKSAITMTFPVSHYSGCGNDFLLIDNRHGELPELPVKVICALCQHPRVDGLIVVHSSKSADVAMKFYNSDGSEAEMCGNGVRCLMQYLRQKLSYPRTRCLLETKTREILLTIEADEIAAQMGEIQELGNNLKLMGYTLHHVNTGVPHVVIFVEDIEAIDVNKEGALLRHHSHFAPQGTNVNFVEKATGRIRTYERGVEAETLACGTGVTAAAYCLYKLYGAHSPITLTVKSGEKLQVIFDEVDGKLDTVTLKGPAKWVRDGKAHLDLDKGCASVEFVS